MGFDELTYGHSKYYPIWTNAIYFGLILYSFISSFRVKGQITRFICYKNSLRLFSVITLAACISSFIYHVNSPAGKDNVEFYDNNFYIKAMKADQVTSLLLTAYSIFILLLVFFFDYSKKLWNVDLLLLILFGIASCLCYAVGYYNSIHAESCKDRQDSTECFHHYQNIYNIYHSAWHLFTSFIGFFWVIFIVRAANR